MQREHLRVEKVLQRWGHWLLLQSLNTPPPIIVHLLQQIEKEKEFGKKKSAHTIVPVVISFLLVCSPLHLSVFLPFYTAKS